MSLLIFLTVCPTLKNDGFPMEFVTFLKNYRFILKDYFGTLCYFFGSIVGGYFCIGIPVWEFFLFCVLSGWPWEYDGVSGALRIIKTCFETCFF